jgi:hypothetical protein
MDLATNSDCEKMNKSGAPIAQPKLKGLSRSQNENDHVSTLPASILGKT